MKYVKPEVNLVDNATRVIQAGKPIQDLPDGGFVENTSVYEPEE